MPVARVNDIEMYYEVQGEGSALLLISGLNSDHGLFRLFVPRWAERYRVIVFDNRGVGRSTGKETPFTVESLADDAAALLGALGIERAHVLGISLGGRIAAALALQHPALVRSLILVSAVLQPPPQTWRRRWIGLLLRLPSVRHGTPYAVVVRQFAAGRRFNCMDRLQELRIPVLILHGSKDSSVPRRVVQLMHERIGGSQITAFPGHHLFFLLRAKQFTDAVLQFLDAVDR
jgi:pimeloyl-ACP methyl ester carboxylesterase